MKGSLVGRGFGDFSSQVLQAASENGELTYVNVTYSTAAPCSVAPSKHFQTTIRIICDYGARFDIVPAKPWVDVVYNDTCSAQIQAASLHACPLNRDLCQFTLHDSPTQSAVYELSSLAASRDTIHQARGAPNTVFNTSEVLFNICAPVLIPFLASGDCDFDTAACLVNTSVARTEGVGVRTAPLPSGAGSEAGGVETYESGFERLGRQSSLQVEKHPGGVEAGVVLAYRSGSRCGSDTYTLRLQLDCEPSCHPPDLCIRSHDGGGFSLSNPPCGFLITAGSSAACPEIIGARSSYGSIVSLVILCMLVGGLVAYCSLGSIVNLARGCRGPRIIPNYDSWVEFFSYVRAGSGTLLGCCPNSNVSRMTGGFSGGSDADFGEAGSGGPSEGIYGTF